MNLLIEVLMFGIFKKYNEEEVVSKMINQLLSQIDLKLKNGDIDSDHHKRILKSVKINYSKVIKTATMYVQFAFYDSSSNTISKEKFDIIMWPWLSVALPVLIFKSHFSNDNFDFEEAYLAHFQTYIESQTQAHEEIMQEDPNYKLSPVEIEMAKYIYAAKETVDFLYRKEEYESQR